MDDVVRARIDAGLKKSANTVLRKIGLTPSSAFRLLMVRIATEQRLPFEPLVPNAETEAAMREARKGGLRRFKNASEMLATLNAEEGQEKKRAKRPSRAAGKDASGSGKAAHR
jgi:DNA-damage-inducible protein J